MGIRVGMVIPGMNLPNQVGITVTRHVRGLFFCLHAMPYISHACMCHASPHCTPYHSRMLCRVHPGIYVWDRQGALQRSSMELGLIERRAGSLVKTIARSSI